MASDILEPLRAVHERNGRFFNPWPAPPHPSFRDFLRWRFTPNRFEKTPWRPPVVANDGTSLGGREPGLAITWIGHASFALHAGGDVVLTDPHFAPRAVVVPRVVPPGIPLGAVPETALALVSHNHYDHLDAYSVDRLPAALTWFVPKGLAAWFRRRGRRAVELDWWESARSGEVTLTCLPAQHWSRRLGQARDATLWGSWLIETAAGQRVYFGGDTGYFAGFAAYGRELGPIDVALLPIGSYEPRWFMCGAHMNPPEAYRAFLDLGARTMIPMHYGTFDLTDEPLDRPPRDLAEAVAATAGPERASAAGDGVRILAIGETLRLP